MRPPPATLPFPSLYPRPPCSAALGHPLVPPPPLAYKRHPRLLRITHLTHRNLLDNISLSPVPYVELGDLDRPVDHHPFPALPSLPRRSACGRWPRHDSSAAEAPRRRLLPAQVSSPTTATSQQPPSPPSMSRRRKRSQAVGFCPNRTTHVSRTPSGYQASDRRAPPVSPLFFFHAHPGSPRWASPSSSAPARINLVSLVFFRGKRLFICLNYCNLQP
jgi:hypothetical protein